MRVREVSVWKKGGQRAPHKPLLILYALGKLLEGQDEIPFKDFYEPFRDLLQEFGPPRKVYHPEFPFWFLRSEEFWEIEPATLPSAPGRVAHEQVSQTLFVLRQLRDLVPRFGTR